MTFIIRVHEIVSIQEDLWESLEVHENSVWKNAVDLLHRQLDDSNKEKRSLK
jgi:hypothetical protein